jgi:alpha-methylacyl-CoA racemase
VPTPLDGVRILDLSRLLPGPFCSLMLADLGADVIKIEDLGRGDYARWEEPRLEGSDPSIASPIFLSLNRNKRSAQIDLKREEGRETLLRLVESADVLLESFRPGVLDRLGLGYDRLLARNPRLVICAITGYGQSGPKRETPGHDLNYLASVGVVDLSGDTDTPPVQASVQVADVGGGALTAALGILAALRHAERTGEGQVVDVSMAHSSLSWLAPQAAQTLNGLPTPQRGELALGGGLVCYRIYRCADGFISFGALEEKFWNSFCAGVKRRDLLGRRFDAPGSDTHGELERIFEARTREEWRSFDELHQCCLEPVVTLDEALSSEFVGEREMIVEVAQPGLARPVELIGSPLAMSATPPEPARRPAPGIGADTEEVLREAGFGSDEIAELGTAGAIGRSARRSLR